MTADLIQRLRAEAEAQGQWGTRATVALLTEAADEISRLTEQSEARGRELVDCYRAAGGTKDYTVVGYGAVYAVVADALTQAAQAKPVAQWSSRIGDGWTGWYDGELPGWVREPSQYRTRTLYAAPPALEQAARQLLAAWRFQDMSVTMDEAYAALKKALGERE